MICFWCYTKFRTSFVNTLTVFEWQSARLDYATVQSPMKPKSIFNDGRIHNFYTIHLVVIIKAVLPPRYVFLLPSKCANLKCKVVFPLSCLRQSLVIKPSLYSESGRCVRSIQSAFLASRVIDKCFVAGGMLSEKNSI